MEKFITRTPINKNIASKGLPSIPKAPPADPPKDIASIGEKIVQIILPSYPRNKDGRCFQKEWYKKFSWVEYSPSKDAAFCYPCRQFLSNASSESAFTITGYKNWKAALEKSKGLSKHDSCKSHISAMLMWSERNKRETLGHEVSTMVYEEQLKKNRYYVKSIAEMIQFLAIHELPLRGTYDIEEHEEDSLLKHFFEFTLNKDDVLKEYFKTIPKNATYLSPDIQNDIIKLLSECVREKIAEDIKNADVPWYTILADGTKDKKGNENFAIGIRYVKDGKAVESTLSIKTTSDLDAQSLTNLILTTLKENGLSVNNIISQCYDGASVMSGKRGGVQAILQQKTNRRIPYVHCGNHRLHLVIVKAFDEVSSIKQFFEQCSLLYMFLKRSSVARHYEGNALSRLLEQRWCGHLNMVEVVLKNYREIVKVLNFIASGQCKDCDGGEISEAIGLISVVTTKKYRFCLVFLRRLLKILEPADRGLQARETSLNDGILLIDSVTSSVRSLRTEERHYEEIDQECTSGDLNVENEISSDTEPRIKRRKTPSALLKNYLTMGTTGVDQYSESLKQIFSETIDIVLNELTKRFNDNEELLKAISSAEELDVDNMSHLSALGIELPSKEELTVVKSFLTKFENCNAFKKIYEQKEVFDKTYKLLATVRTFGCSTALCESTFSVLTRVNRLQRLAMSNERLANLVFLSFEKHRTKNIDFDIFLRKFNNLKNRRLQLF